jgi:hypothetical protein
VYQAHGGCAHQILNGSIPQKVKMAVYGNGREIMRDGQRLPKGETDEMPSSKHVVHA